jgi:nitrite reductase/ring-hydroxylating ferredoxin subunit
MRAIAANYTPRLQWADRAPARPCARTGGAMAFVEMGRTADVPAGHGLLVEKDGRSVALFNAGGGRFYACSPLCPHEDGPLAEGWLEAQSVVCPWHGFDFDLATGKCLVDADLAISVYPVRVTGDRIEVDLP